MRGCFFYSECENYAASPKHGFFQLLLWRLRDMNNFEFWRQFSAFVELILGVKVAPNRADANLEKSRGHSVSAEAGSLSPTLSLWKIQYCSYHEVCIEEVKKCHVYIYHKIKIFSFGLCTRRQNMFQKELWHCARRGLRAVRSTCVSLSNCPLESQ